MEAFSDGLKIIEKAFSPRRIVLMLDDEILQKVIDERLCKGLIAQN